MADIAHWARASGLARLQLLADRRNRLALAFYDRLAFQATNMICLRTRCPRKSQEIGPERQARKRGQER
jgi:hypothetical protein